MAIEENDISREFLVAYTSLMAKSRPRLSVPNGLAVFPPFIKDGGLRRLINSVFPKSTGNRIPANMENPAIRQNPTIKNRTNGGILAPCFFNVYLPFLEFFPDPGIQQSITDIYQHIGNGD
jgi:hypothetical protein